MSQPIDFKSVLNPAQLQAATTLNGALLVIAGAGSGKTRTLVYRVARLVETGVTPESILLLTFTRKAAGEMLDRAAGLADEKCRYVSGGTFHSLAHRVLRNYAGLLGFEKTFTILDRADMEEAVHALVKDIRIEGTTLRFPKRGTLTSIISKAANLQISTEDLIIEDYTQFLECAPQINRLRGLYSEYKRENQLMDYDDLILFFRQLLVENEEVREVLGEQYRYIMVDEYQDTNKIQAEIVQYLARSHGNIMVVGDDSQSIYSFRGANYKNMFSFPDLFEHVTTIKLEENYRSTQPILAFTNALMDKAQEKYTKCLFTKRKDGELPRVVDTRTEPEQALYICRVIKEHVKRGLTLRDFAVLFRAGYQSFELEMELARQGLPFVKYGGFKFMESAHIKDLLAHLRVIANRQDVVSWSRILRLIKNIGHGKSQTILNWMKAEGVLPGGVGQWPGAGKKDGGLRGLEELMKKLTARELMPQRAVEYVMQYYDPILKETFDDYPKRQRDLEQLVSMAARYRSLRSFLDDIVLEPPTSQADLTPEQRGDVLTLSTVHSAKGLEWCVVFVIWVMDGYFPSSKAHSNQDALEEERRLMYVAATRAKDQLVLCYPGSETGHFSGSFGGVALRPGRGPCSFVQELPEGVMEHHRTGFHGGRRVFPGTHKKSRGFEPEGRPSGLRLGDRVAHPAFGKGVIAKISDKDKVEVLFGKVGRKLLHLGYTTLEKI
ncbi:MAG: ATP-dependent helicase [Desulfatiglandales bacterium]